MKTIESIKATGTIVKKTIVLYRIFVY